MTKGFLSFVSRKRFKAKTTAMIVAVCAAAIVVIDFIQRSKAPASQAALARSQGAANAPIHITEYVDFTSDECARTAASLREYMHRYPSKIFLEMKYFPNRSASIESAIYADCAAQQSKFWPFYEFLFERQWQWNNKDNAKDVFVKAAETMGVDITQLDSCVNGPLARSTVLAEKTEGELNRISHTPTYFINGKMVVGYRGLKETLEELLEI